jgi:hypothetical protein
MSIDLFKGFLYAFPDMASKNTGAGMRAHLRDAGRGVVLAIVWQ